MRTLWKFPVAVTDVVRLTMPAGAAFRHAAPSSTYPDEVETWWEVDDQAAPENIVLRIHGTGHAIEGHDYLATALMPGGLVWHLYREHPTRAFVFGYASRSMAAVRRSTWGRNLALRDAQDLRGESFRPSDVIAGPVPAGWLDSEAVARASYNLPRGWTAADLVREV